MIVSRTHKGIKARSSALCRSNMTCKIVASNSVSDLLPQLAIHSILSKRPFSNHIALPKLQEKASSRTRTSTCKLMASMLLMTFQERKPKKIKLLLLVFGLSTNVVYLHAFPGVTVCSSALTRNGLI